MIKEVLSGYVKHGLKLRKFQVYPPKEFSLDDVDVVKMAMYSVSRISRLVDMYHGLHAALDKEEAAEEGQKAKEDADEKKFSCPTCKRKSWQSIETFRTHKRACR